MLNPGTSVGAYEVVSLLGKGGMGEVYRARDTRLKRDVALKILPDFFSDDPERLVRFHREARVLAALSHPCVAGIYGFEESNGRRALVLELVEGETLADRLARGAIPVAEALPIARQIAEALEYAHEQGVVHRDLKPSNIKITPQGVVKVLDFGLAKLSDRNAVEQPDATASPTMAEISGIGVVLGTAAYMSPEQARGKSADKRSDVWAFGCVLYEMLTGRRAFEGDEFTDTLANVLKSSPDWTRLPADTPASIRRLLRRCLEKDRTQRLPDTAGARFEISDTLAHLDEQEGLPASSSRGTRWGPWAIAAAGIAMAALAIALWAPWRTPRPAAPSWLTVELGADAALDTTLGSASVVISPDGHTLAFVAQPKEGPQRLFVRPLDQLRSTPLSGTENASGPFFSPDGKWIGFFAEGKLKKVAVTGGATFTLADAPVVSRGGTWTERNTIIFATQPNVGLLQEVPDNGGSPVAVTPPPAQIGGVPLWPQILPGSSAVLFTTAVAPGLLAEATLRVQPLSGGDPQVVLPGAHYGRYVESGHLLYMSQGTVFAAPFDLKTLQVTGGGVPILENVQFNATNGSAQFDVSRAGTLIFTPGTAQIVDRPLSWLDASGRITPIKSSLDTWGTPSFSPDGLRVAMTRITGRGDPDIWTYDLTRDTLVRVTLDAGVQAVPVWTPDGRRIVYGSASPNAPNLYWKRADGTGEAQRLTTSEAPQLPGSWHPTRPILAFHEGNPPAPQRVMLLEIDGDEASGWKPRQPTEFIGGPSRNALPIFSPDGSWIAYLSDKSGRFELYVRPFPGPGDEVQISSGGGNDPKWTRRELFYTTFPATPNAEGQIMVAPYTAVAGTFRPEKPRVWSPARLSSPPYGAVGINLDLHPDGRRFAVAAAPGAPALTPRDSVTMVTAFFEELKARALPR